ncbi:unnamed protein product [Adineta steineri]|uniref:Uncharacterized protein n=1 Tax=Adineta steineri TaxID=433720 RepID=A0A813Z6T1_9BILA|nr:unnamed protein product [Adineta steineri]CAF3706135.1 unnamed protein product [Adineta steineri]
MTDDSSSSPPKNLSSWNFNELNHDDESNSSSDFFSVLKKNVAKHVYLDEHIHSNSNNATKNCLNEQSTTTIRIDSSDLISRCKNFLPLLTDANRTLFSKIESGENVRIELDSDEDEQRQIEMNLMFCPNVDTSSQSEDSSDDENNDEKIESTLLQLPKKKVSVNIVEIESTDDKKI